MVELSLYIQAGKFNMFKRIITLFKIVRTLALSDALEVIYKVHQPPTSIKLIFKLFSISFQKKNDSFSELEDEEKLCRSIQKMGTSFIKLGQFLSTRPDIIGVKLSFQLET